MTKSDLINFFFFSSFLNWILKHELRRGFFTCGNCCLTLISGILSNQKKLLFWSSERQRQSLMFSTLLPSRSFQLLCVSLAYDAYSVQSWLGLSLFIRHQYDPLQNDWSKLHFCHNFATALARKALSLTVAFDLRWTWETFLWGDGDTWYASDGRWVKKRSTTILFYPWCSWYNFFFYKSICLKNQTFCFHVNNIQDKMQILNYYGII